MSKIGSLLMPAWNAPTLQLLFCWKCNVSQPPFIYKYRGINKIEILSYQKGKLPSDFPYEDYPDTFEGRSVQLMLIPKPLAELQVLASDSDFDLPMWLDVCLRMPQHQILGSPFVHCDDTQICFCCKREMYLLATIADDVGMGQLLTGNSEVQTVFFSCPDCRIILATQYCD